MSCYSTSSLRSVLKVKLAVETINPKKREAPKGFLKAIVGAANRQTETKRVEEEVAAGRVEEDLAKALDVSLAYS